MKHHEFDAGTRVLVTSPVDGQEPAKGTVRRRFNPLKDGHCWTLVRLDAGAPDWTYSLDMISDTAKKDWNGCVRVWSACLERTNIEEDQAERAKEEMRLIRRRFIRLMNSTATGEADADLDALEGLSASAAAMADAVRKLRRQVRAS